MKKLLAQQEMSLNATRILLAAALVVAISFVPISNVNAGCGIVLQGDCLYSYSHYVNGTDLPCAGNCGGCELEQCY